jgi:phage-related minor tail protein
VVATVTYAAKASTGKAPWSLVAGTTLGVAYLLMSVWMATVAFVAGADSVEGMIAVAGAGIAILGGVVLTSACALMFADRLRKRAQSRSSASFAQGIYPVR